MVFYKDISPERLSQLCESWSREELKEGAQFFAALTKKDSYYFRHVKELLSEMEVRGHLGW